MTTAEAAPDSLAPTRPVALRLARLHLRLGAHELARAELEAAAGDATLDEDALLDLAEVRWRTGDLLGAGVAANAFIGTGRSDPLAFVIAAEAAGSAGHTLEARRLAASALAGLPSPLDPVFAGMPRGSFWPTDHTAPGDPAGAFFGTDAVGGSLSGSPSAAVALPVGVAVGAPESEAGDREQGDASEEGVATAVAGDGGPGLWADHEMEPSISDPDRARSAAVAEARASLEAGDHAMAADRLAELLRARPDLAATVLGALGDGPAGGPVAGDPSATSRERPAVVDEAR